MHGHDHSHSHAHGPQDSGHAFLIGIALNTVFIIAEVIAGLLSNSLALLSDAGHNASDVLGLALAWGATALAKRKPTARFTYGLQSSSIMAALTNAVLLLVATGGIAWEAVERLSHPVAATSTTIMVVASIGILINGFTAWLFSRGSRHDLNIRGAYLHMAADAAVSLGVVISGFILMQTGWQWIDPVTSLVVAAIIVISGWGLLRDSINMALHAVPSHIDLGEVKNFILSREGVAGVHDLHIWAMSTTETALSAHVAMKENYPGDKFLKDIAHALEHRFNIGHSTIQIELGNCEIDCA